jgi:hypothetical protein
MVYFSNVVCARVARNDINRPTVGLPLSTSAFPPFHLGLHAFSPFSNVLTMSRPPSSPFWAKSTAAPSPFPHLDGAEDVKPNIALAGILGEIGNANTSSNLSRQGSKTSVDKAVVGQEPVDVKPQDPFRQLGIRQWTTPTPSPPASDAAGPQEDYLGYGGEREEDEEMKDEDAYDDSIEAKRREPSIDTGKHYPFLTLISCHQYTDSVAYLLLFQRVSWILETYVPRGLTTPRPASLKQTRFSATVRTSTPLPFRLPPKRADLVTLRLHSQYPSYSNLRTSAPPELSVWKRGRKTSDCSGRR